MTWPFRSRSAASLRRPQAITAAEDLVLLDTVDPKLVVHHDPNGRAAEQYRGLRTNLRAMNPGRLPRALLFTSAEAGVGKSVSVGNLALAMSECDDVKVCLVDADLRAAGLSELFGVDDRPGLAEILLERCEPESVLFPTGRANLAVLPAGKPGLDPSLALASTHLPELVAWLKRRFQYVILDCAPVLLFSDAGELGKVSDGSILTVSIGGTMKSEADRALAQLRAAGATVIGTLVTGAESSLDGAYDPYPYADAEG